MDKEYLIHNIDYKDNPEDQHMTIDITLSNLELAGQDITADVGIDTFVNGVPSGSNKYEDVSLTGAGGGGDSDFSTATIQYTTTTAAVTNIPAYNEEEGISFTTAYSASVSQPIPVILYKGGCIVQIAAGYTYSVSGNAEDLGGRMVLITGDCALNVEVS